VFAIGLMAPNGIAKDARERERENSTTLFQSSWPCRERNAGPGVQATS
jgi:hypothetical protein